MVDDLSRLWQKGAEVVHPYERPQLCLPDLSAVALQVPVSQGTAGRDSDAGPAYAGDGIRPDTRMF